MFTARVSDIIYSVSFYAPPRSSFPVEMFEEIKTSLALKPSKGFC